MHKFTQKENNIKAKLFNHYKSNSYIFSLIFKFSILGINK